MRVMLDSNVYDLLLENSALFEQVDRAVRAGQLDLLTTHVQLDELSLIKDQAKREAVLELAITFVKVPTAGAVWDVSKWDDASWGDDTGRLDAMIGGNPKHAEDALIAATADAEAEVLVTNETRLPGRVKRFGFTVKVWSPNQFSEWLRSLT
ncbi:hypothetical protein [Bradyrhizobium sp. C9]|uniref:hypothetical protein n=1 Tax=Bradyrhizobium sp. C9 TaxID=142585 RepID=UPI0011779443|nr:hypothetical protein [Bradyrhizobium sp. C9]